MALKFTHNDTEFNVGDTIKVNYKIKEKGDRERIQAFDGIILSVKGRNENQNFVVRKSASDGIFVERIFPVQSPWIDSIKKLRGPKRTVRRAKLYYLRDSKARTL
ncbi:MAG: 50S ribosomal protein L19 [Patescibacteria group bacterium]|jgi:large subunit ribosomal protein L19